MNSLFNLFTTKIMGTLESTVKRLIINNIRKTSVCFEDYVTTSDSSFTLNETHGETNFESTRLQAWMVFLQSF